MTVAELKTMWSPEAEGKVTKWSDVREGWPAEKLQLLGPGVDSGTYDYFTKAIVGTEHATRGDFAPNEDDNVLVHGVSTDKGADPAYGLVQERLDSRISGSLFSGGSTAKVASRLCVLSASTALGSGIACATSVANASVDFFVAAASDFGLDVAFEDSIQTLTLESS